MFYRIIIFTLTFLFAMGELWGNSRVAFSRPGRMMRIPSSDQSMQQNLLSINLSSELLSSTQSSSAFSVSSQTSTGYLYGLSFVKPVNPAETTELGLHIQKTALMYGTVTLDLGVQDILFRQVDTSSDTSSVAGSGLYTGGISLFSVLTSTKEFENYSLSTYLGLGSGKIGRDSHLYEENLEQSIGVFMGFQFSTPYLLENGGVDVLAEFDGQGLNVGLSIPLTKSYLLNLGVTHFEKLGEFGRSDKQGSEGGDLMGDDPSITFGIRMNIPRVFQPGDKGADGALGSGIYGETDSSILFYDPICTEIVELLRDSIRVGQNQVSYLESFNLELMHDEAILEDSTRKYLLREQVSQSKQNKAMRHLSRSLRYFYEERFRDALVEANAAIELNPNLAIAYGRRGSIYYKLGDTRRATLNWNVALQLDPEFTEIYNMLKAADENRLEPVEIGKNTGD